VYLRIVHGAAPTQAFQSTWLSEPEQSFEMLGPFWLNVLAPLLILTLIDTAPVFPLKGTLLVNNPALEADLVVETPPIVTVTTALPGVKTEKLTWSRAQSVGGYVLVPPNAAVGCKWCRQCRRRSWGSSGTRR